MQVLADTELRKLLHRRELVIDPFPEMEQLQPASADIRLGKTYQHTRVCSRIRCFGSDYDEDSFLEEIDYDGELLLDPHHTSIQETTERIRIPRQMWGKMFQRSRFGRALCKAANFGFKNDNKGNNYYLHHRENPERVRYLFVPYVRTRLRKRERVCQLILFDLEGPPRIGKDRAVREGHLDIQNSADVCKRCGSIYLHAQDVYSPRRNVTFDPHESVGLSNYERVEEKKLPPQTPFLAVTREQFRFKNTLAGCVDSVPWCIDLWHRQYFMHSCFEAGFIDPGYEGPFALQLYSNWGPIDLEKPVATLTLYPVKGKVERPYGLFSLGSSHQGRFEQ
jgi:deoxycytidine triphosphate deaminase